MDSSDAAEIGIVVMHNTTVPTVVETVDAPAHTEQTEQSAEAEQPLKSLRTWRKFSQQSLALAMGTSQGEISRIEKRKDMHVSTLRSYIRAIGGEVVILAKFANEEVVQITI